ncbi:hypothetical protein EC991_009760 [Linnemannia zychae]|nr:hypothetical protein EC991_009760 [Linnemannia zychae]
MNPFVTSSSGSSPRSNHTPMVNLAEIDSPTSSAKLPFSRKPTVVPPTEEPDNPCSVAQRRYFTGTDAVLSRAKTLSIAGKTEGPRFQPQPDMCAHLPEQTAAFKFFGHFKNYSTGHYTVHWRVKALQDFYIPNGLHFVVKITYDTEPDISGTLDVILPAHKLNTLGRDHWTNLTLEEKVVIQPHEGWANIQVMLLNNGNENRDEYSGLLIEHVEIRPVGIRMDTRNGVRNMIVQRASMPVMVVDTTKAFPKSEDFSYFPSDAPITRLAVSKKSRYIASLGVGKDDIYIAVWDMGIVKNPSNPYRDMSALYKNSATIRIHHPGVGDHAIGISISAFGDQVAVFEEPKIGQWLEGSEVPKPSFKFRLFNNPLVPPVSFTMDIDAQSTSNINEKVQDTASQDRSGRGRRDTSSSSGSSSTTPNTGDLLLEEVEWEHEILQSLVGFGEFVPGGRKNDWESNDLGVVSSNVDDSEESAGKEAKETKPGSNYYNNFFVTCNGIYIDVYEITPERRWKRLHTITITDLIPTLSRRITCKMMMDSISSNNLMWLEDGGRSCTIWNLRTGSNIAHISSLDNALFKGPTFRGHSKMAISPHESIVALASVDGSLTTYFANTGMAIDDRKFPGYKIEYVGFSSQDDKLIVVLRDSVSFELVAKQLDTLQLKSETIINQTPIPTIGSTLLTYFNIRGYFGRGLVFEADGAKMNCYISYQPSSSKVNRASDTVLQSHPADVLYESQYDDHIQYRLQTAFHRELLPEGDGVFYWVHRVEVIREDLKDRTQRLIFSFIPEPWMRATTAEVSNPENLLTAFFVPCGTRFAINGTQTLQVWNLPTHENSNCTLQYIWSQPRGEEDLAPGGIAYQSVRVRDYYMETMDATIFLDRVTGNTLAEIKLNDKSKKKVPLAIPGPGTIGAHFAILHCFRSIHLLAAAYAFSSRESKKASRDAQQSFTFEDHAEAILRFTREHINRMMTIGVYISNKKSGGGGGGGGGGGNFQANNYGPRRRPNNRGPRVEKSSPPTDAITLLPGAVGFGTPQGGSAVAAGPRIVGEDVTIHGNSNRRQAESFDDRPAPLQIQETIEEIIRPRDFAQAKDFVQAKDFNFPTRTPRQPPTNRPQVVTVLTLLLDQKYLQRTNHLFVQGLLNTANGDWIPRDNQALNPIRRAIESRNVALVEAFIDYCILNAKKYHPAYLMPAVQCLNELSERYPVILADMFRKASYVPAHNHAYVSSHAMVANAQYTEWLKSKLMFWNMFTGNSFEKSNNINDYEKPVFSLRSQLPFRSTSLLSVLNIETSIRENRREKFPSKREPVSDEIRKKSNKDYKIYVTPFPKLSMYGPYKPWYKGLDTAQSAFTDIAGEDFFDSPAMVATLEFKWHKFGFRYWLVRFVFVLVFFLLIVTITAQQIAYSTGDVIFYRYMENWRPVIMVAVALGVGLYGYEAMQFIYAPRKYIRSPYNYLDLSAYALAIVGCISLVNATPGIKPGNTIDIGPSQIPIMSFAILFVYFNILFELRVVRQLGIVVNIILNITRSIVWFFIIFFLILVGFTHALMHLLHTKSFHPVCPPDLPTNATLIPDEFQDCAEKQDFPTEFFSALSATYFFLSGRYDPVEKSFEGNEVSFHVMMILFFFISAILFLNILIALMNDAFNESKDQGQLAWLKQWSEVIAEVEVFLMTQSTRQNRNYFPDYIYYGANEQEAELYESRFFIASKSNLSIENRFLIDTVTVEQNATQLTQRQVLRDVQTLSRELEKMKGNQEAFNQDIIRLTEVVAAFLATVAPVPSSSSYQGTGSDRDEYDDDDGDDGGSSHSETDVSPIEHDPPTSGISMGETQSAPPGGASGPPSPPVPSPPPPTAVPGGTTSLPSPGGSISLPAPPPTRASSAPVVPTIPIPTASNSSSVSRPPPSQGASSPVRPSITRPIAAGPAPGASAPRPLFPSYPGAPSQIPSFPGSAGPPPPPVPPLAQPVQSSTPYSMPMPIQPLPASSAEQEEVPDLSMGIEERISAPAVEERMSAPALEERKSAPLSESKDVQEEGKSSSSSPYELDISFGMDDKENRREGRKEGSRWEDKSEDEDEENEDEQGSGGAAIDIPAPPHPPSVITRPIHSSSRPAMSKKTPAPPLEQRQQQPPVSVPATAPIPTPTSAPPQAGGRKFKKISPAAETTDSPTTYTPTTGGAPGGGRYNPPPISTTVPVSTPATRKRQQQPKQQQQPVPPVLSQLPAGGPAVYHPQIGGSTTSTTAPGHPRYKVIELPDPERSYPSRTQTTPSATTKPTTGNNTSTTTTNTSSSFRQRVQKVVAVQTVDDALRARRRIEDNNVSHPVYVVHQPATSSSRERQRQRFRRESDDDALFDDDDDVDEEVEELEVIDEEEEGQSPRGITSGLTNTKGKNVRSSTAPSPPSVQTSDEIQPYPPSQGRQQQRRQ